MSTQAFEQEIAARDRLYKPSAKTPEIVDVPPMNFLMVDGAGDPNTSQAYRDALEALYAMAYTLKFASKKADGVSYKVAPLEGLWWSDDMNAFPTGAKDTWSWTMMIAQPSIVTPAWVEQAKEEVRRKKAPVALPL
ncbi:MAG: GyrI-like domain-containing protein, partial [Caldilinea sp.]|nr:GyrI-like domain-containing protein [Caldilinea sp.]